MSASVRSLFALPIMREITSSFLMYLEVSRGKYHGPRSHEDGVSLTEEHVWAGQTHVLAACDET